MRALTFVACFSIHEVTGRPLQKYLVQPKTKKKKSDLAGKEFDSSEANMWFFTHIYILPTAFMGQN